MIMDSLHHNDLCFFTKLHETVSPCFLELAAPTPVPLPLGFFFLTLFCHDLRLWNSFSQCLKLNMPEVNPKLTHLEPTIHNERPMAQARCIPLYSVIVMFLPNSAAVWLVILAYLLQATAIRKFLPPFTRETANGQTTSWLLHTLAHGILQLLLAISCLGMPSPPTCNVHAAVIFWFLVFFRSRSLRPLAGSKSGHLRGF